MTVKDDEDLLKFIIAEKDAELADKDAKLAKTAEDNDTIRAQLRAAGIEPVV